MTWQHLLDQHTQNKQILESTEAFALKYAPVLWKEDKPFQYLDWYRQIDAMKSNFKLVLVHPGSGKSTRLKWEAVRRITKDRGYKVAYISKSSEKAGLFMDSIGEELRRNKLLIDDYGEFWEYGILWNKSSIKVLGSGAVATPTLSHYGVTSQIEGMRPNLIIVDDPIDIHTVHSPAECESIQDVFPTWLQRLDIVSGNSEIWVIGHRFSPVDLYTYIETFPPDQPDSVFDTLILESYNEQTKQMLAPELWGSWERFENSVLKAHKEYEIKAHYQQRLVHPSNCPFKWEWLENNFIDSPEPTRQVLAKFDPAYTKGRKSDYSAAACGYWFKDGLFISGLEHWRIDSGWESKFCGFGLDHHARVLEPEINNAQTLEDSMKRFIRDNELSMTVRGFKSVDNKELRIGDLEVPARTGKIWFEDSLRESSVISDLRGQWETFPNSSHDDLLDVIHMLFIRLRKGGSGIRGFDKKDIFG